LIDEGKEGRGSWKKRMLSCNERDRSSKFTPIRKDADFHRWWFMARKETKFYEHSKPNNSQEWATVNSKQLGLMWNNISWVPIWMRVNKLQSRIAKATSEELRNLNLPPPSKR
jgi:hypothetical protein